MRLYERRPVKLNQTVRFILPRRLNPSSQIFNLITVMQLAKCTQCGVVSLPGLSECQRCGAPVLTVTPNAFAPHAPASRRVTVTEAAYEPVAQNTPPRAPEVTPTVVETPLMVEEINCHKPDATPQDWQNTPEMDFFTAAAPALETPALVPVTENVGPVTDFTPSDFVNEIPPAESFAPNSEYQETQCATSSGQHYYTAPEGLTQTDPPADYDPQYYAARAAAREAAQAQELHHKRQPFLAQPQYAAQNRPFTFYVNPSARSSPSTGIVPMLFKVIIYPMLAMALIIGVWKFAFPHFFTKADDPNLPKSGRPWFSSWTRDAPTAEEIIQKHAQVSGEDKFPHGPKMLYMKGAVEMFGPPPPNSERNPIIYMRDLRTGVPIPIPTPSAYKPTTFIEWKASKETVGVGTFEGATTDGKMSLIIGLHVKDRIVHQQQALAAGQAWETQIIYANSHASGWKLESEKTENLTETDKDQLKKMSLGSFVDRDPIQKTQYKGNAGVNGILVYEVLVTKGNGQEETRFYDVETGLISCMQVEMIGKKGEAVNFTMFFEDYREVNGVKLPFMLKQKAVSSGTAMAMILKMEQYSFDGTINPQFFERLTARQSALSETSSTLMFPLLKVAATPSPAPFQAKDKPPAVVAAPPDDQQQEMPRRDTVKEKNKTAPPVPPVPPVRKKTGNGLFEGMMPVGEN